MFFFLGRAEWCSLPFSWDTKSSFIQIQNHFSGFFGKKRFFCHFDITLNFDIRESDLKSTSTFTFGTLPWLLFAFPSFFICTLSHCNALLIFKVIIKAEWKCVSFWRGAVKRSVAKIKIFDPPKLGESKQAKTFCILRPFQAYYYHFQHIISFWSEIPTLATYFFRRRSLLEEASDQ